jgi:hypothetical protein
VGDGAGPARPPADRGALWEEAYAPRSLDELVCSASAKNGLRLYLESCASGQPSHAAALVSGPPGTGKSTLARLTAQACGYSPVYPDVVCDDGGFLLNEAESVDGKPENWLALHVARRLGVVGLSASVGACRPPSVTVVETLESYDEAAVVRLLAQLSAIHDVRTRHAQQRTTAGAPTRPPRSGARGRAAWLPSRRTARCPSS